MTNHRCGALVTLLVLLSTQACSTEQPRGRKDTVAPTESLPRTPMPPADHLAAVWDTTLGSYFAVAGGTASTALLVYPEYASSQRLDTLRIDSASVVGLQLDLLGADSVLSARVAGLEADTVSDCASWPTVRVVLGDRQLLAQPWTVGVPPHRAATVAFDSLVGLPSRDSTRLTISVARAASKALGDTAAAFRGRPFVVRQANRFRLDDGQDAVLAEVVRVVTQEANPLQEQLLLVLESDSGSARPVYTLAYSARQIGLEEAIESIELVSVLRLRDGTWGLLLHREVGEGSRFELLERERPGAWRLRWRSAYAGC